MKEIINRIFNELNINSDNGLATEETIDKMTTYQRLLYSQAKEKIGADAVYFLRDADGMAKIPLIYFSMMDTSSAEAAARIHCLSWNMGEAPLLFIVTPTELKIFNNYKSPRNIDGSLDSRAGLIETISLITDLETQRQKLSAYNRIMLESGEYWRRSRERFDVNMRVDTTLMNNLKIMRRKLIQTITARLSDDRIETINVVSIVHGLLSRSILIKYLEERKDSNGQSVFPDNFYEQFSLNGLKCKQYTDVLDSKEATYKLFEVLEAKFNGDMLPLAENEHELVTETDLRELRQFLIGDSDLENQQLVLWPLYDFNVIPIQIISSIYELFFHLSDVDDDDKGTYYTPLHLVDTLLDEVYPWEGKYEQIAIMDPSCGSGIFLVEAYRRIVCRWMNTNNTLKINSEQLTKLLKDSIYGVDINIEAVRVASFSLSLALCDFLDPRSIWDDLLFPKLVNSNLAVSDFFDKDKEFNLRKYDIVIGNPPWQSQLTDNATHYLKEKNKVVGDKQIAQAFSLKCVDLCEDTGVICLLMPSKGFLFNRSKKSSQYRKDFFENNSVSVIINLSIYRRFLFDHASGPAAGVIYFPIKPSDNQLIFYCTPKPQFTAQDSKKFSIEPTDICKIPMDIVTDDRIWKIAMWGSPRDLELIDRLQSTYPTLLSYIETNEMCSAEGFKRGNRSKTCTDFIGLPNIEARSFESFYMNEDDLERINYTEFECIVSEKRDIFKAPHLVIKQSHKKSRFLAAVLDYDAVFNHSLLGIHGDINKLKYLCLIINSRVFSYYHMLTNRKWLVERDELEAGDIWATPTPIPDSTMIEEAVVLFDGLVSGKIDEQMMENYVYKIYRMKSYEIELVNDALDYIYNYFDKQGKSMVFEVPSIESYNLYYKTLIEVLHNTLGKSIIQNGHLFIGDAPLSVLVLSLEGNCSEALEVNENTLDVKQLLEKLDSMLTEERNNIFIRRNVRIYSKDAIYIIKPMQKKYWNYSSACRDSDEIFADIMKTWRCNNE
jgi:hypothetical protein